MTEPPSEPSEPSGPPAPGPSPIPAAGTTASHSRSLPASWPVRKLVHIGLLILATLLAGWPISDVIEEREHRQIDMQEEFQQSWGPKQDVHNPILVVPYQLAADQPRQYLKIVPAQLKATVILAPEMRKRGLFHATVYRAAVDFEGSFAIPSDAALSGVLGLTGKAIWTDSFVMLETSGRSGLTDNDRFTWNGDALPWQNCHEIVMKEDGCWTAPVVLAHPHLTTAPTAGTLIGFRASLGMSGTGSFALLFQGKDLEANITAPWPTPSFAGDLLPSSSTVTPQGFEAHWQTMQYTTPQMWSARQIVETPSGGVTASVELLEATPTYRMINRASKYSVVFIVLSFTTYFLFEILTGVRIHILQYGLLGLSLTFFTLLLVSFSEPLGYDIGYALSATLVLLQASLYTATLSRRALHAALFAVMLASLFGFLYVLLSLETYSLLVGSLALFAVLSAVMVLTRRIEWATDTGECKS
jgi:inner membrane protein